MPHPAVPRPAAFIVVSDNIVVSGIGVRTQVALNEVTGFVRGETERNVEFVDVMRVQTDRVASL